MSIEWLPTAQRLIELLLLSLAASLYFLLVSSLGSVDANGSILSPHGFACLLSGHVSSRQIVCRDVRSIDARSNVYIRIEVHHRGIPKLIRCQTRRSRTPRHALKTPNVQLISTRSVAACSRDDHRWTRRILQRTTQHLMSTELRTTKVVARVDEESQHCWETDIADVNRVPFDIHRSTRSYGLPLSTKISSSLVTNRLEGKERLAIVVMVGLVIREKLELMILRTAVLYIV